MPRHKRRVVREMRRGAACNPTQRLRAQGMLTEKRNGHLSARVLCVFDGVADGTRTHDDQNHNLGLYQLSYSHRRESVRV
jgi:hypothetical protein